MSSTGQTNRVVVLLSKPRFYSGETVEGTVIVEVIKPIQIDGIFLMLRGYEQVKFRKNARVNFNSSDSEDDDEDVMAKGEKFGGVDGGNAGAHAASSSGAHGSSGVGSHAGTPKRGHNILPISQPHYDQCNYFNTSMRLYARKGVLQPGHLSFPFSFPLEPDLPSSFSMSGAKFSLQIAYEAEAEVVISGVFTKNVRFIKNIPVVSLSRPFAIPVASVHEMEISSRWCMPRGLVSLWAKTDRSSYMPNDTIRIQIIMDTSRNTRRLGHLTVKLAQEIRLTAMGEVFRNASSIGKTKYETIPAANAERSIEGVLELVLPRDTPPTAETETISCRYYLVFELAVPWSVPVMAHQEVLVVPSHSNPAQTSTTTASPIVKQPSPSLPDQQQQQSPSNNSDNANSHDCGAPATTGNGDEQQHHDSAKE